MKRHTGGLLLVLSLLAPAPVWSQSAGYEPEEEGFVRTPRRPQPDDRFCVSQDASGGWKVERVYLKAVGEPCDNERGTVQRRDQVDIKNPKIRDALARAG